ncbi:Bmp family lipoprotein [Anopheles sinensis]|uniref:Bmp family lipoprotein n=1 Tax=Anopheles sinensis TaxID=74873 RepID=A0A084VMG4_ANOSI|nr:Bmp family lipoprotein [Anopheles sinensis]
MECVCVHPSSPEARQSVAAPDFPPDLKLLGTGRLLWLAAECRKPLSPVRSYTDQGQSKALSSIRSIPFSQQVVPILMGYQDALTPQHHAHVSGKMSFMLSVSAFELPSEKRFCNLRTGVKY